MATQNIHSDQVFIDGLGSNNSEIIKQIYKNYVPKIKNFIKNNSGTIDQADDVVQEVLIALYQQIKTKGLQLTCPFDAFFFLLCKRRWLNELKKKSNKTVTISDETLSVTEALQQQLTQCEQFDEKQELFDAMFAKLGVKCQELLKLSFVTKTLEEVAEKLNVTYGYVRKKKSICTSELTTLIQQSPRFKKTKIDNN